MPKTHIDKKAKGNRTVLDDDMQILFLQTTTLEATALLTDSEFIVLSGSDASLTSNPSLSSGSNTLRKNLIKSRILVLENNKYKFKKDYPFKSSSSAAEVIVGSSISGPQYWKTKDGITLKKFEEQRIAPFTKEKD